LFYPPPPPPTDVSQRQTDSIDWRDMQCHLLSACVVMEDGVNSAEYLASSALSLIGRVHIGERAASHKFYMVSLYRGDILLVQMVCTCIRCA
jgi:hypothetical protein